MFFYFGFKSDIGTKIQIKVWFTGKLINHILQLKLQKNDWVNIMKSPTNLLLYLIRLKLYFIMKSNESKIKFKNGTECQKTINLKNWESMKSREKHYFNKWEKKA